MDKEKEVSEPLTKAEFWAAMNFQEVAWLKRLNEAFGPCELEKAWVVETDKEK